MLLANVTTPLIGLVDTAVLGHLGGAHYLAGASLGVLILTQIYWICGFLRMSSTGLSAQAMGRNDQVGIQRILQQGLLISAVLGVMVWLMHPLLLSAGLQLAAADSAMIASATDYFSVRVVSAPASLANLALMGVMIGVQMHRQVMWLQIAVNALNAILDLVFVLLLEWGVKGVAWASVIAETSLLISALWVCHRRGIVRLLRPSQQEWRALRKVLVLSRDMLIRNLALQACLAFLTLQGARYGAVSAATNAILLQFFMLISLGMDAIAYAVEAQVGQAKGAGHARQLHMNVKRGLFWSGMLAVMYCLLFMVFGGTILSVLTDNDALLASATAYLPVIWALPIIAHWCFLFDGVFVGLANARAMRNSMLVSAFGVYLPCWWLSHDLGNVSLWIALLGFLAARGIILGGYYVVIRRSAAGEAENSG